MTRNSYIVAFYEIDRAYGGPEEGGWWYGCGTLRRVTAVTKSKEKAHQIAGRANDLLHHLQRNQRSVGSVLYSGGRFEARVYKDTAPPGYPQEIPYYE